MLKYVNTDIVFQEFPDEVTLAINLSNCPCHCPGCHSAYLWQDIGQPLTIHRLEELLSEEAIPDLTCVGLMGGDAEPKSVSELARYLRQAHPELKIGWYTGRTTIASDIDRRCFDYIKVGPFLRHLGGLDSPRTNQRMFHLCAGPTAEPVMNDITARFRKG